MDSLTWTDGQMDGMEEERMENGNGIGYENANTSAAQTRGQKERETERQTEAEKSKSKSMLKSMLESKLQSKLATTHTLFTVHPRRLRSVK